MVPIIEKPGVSLTQKRLALLVGGFADFLQIVAFPAFGLGIASPLQDVLDFIVAFLLMAICGFRWQWIIAFVMELVPGLDLLPTWTMVVALMPVRGEGYRGFDLRQDGEQQDGYAQGVDDAGTEPQEANPQVINVTGVVVPPVRGPAMPNAR